MSANHKRPLLAFAMVLVVCVLIVVDGLRGQAAVVTALRSGAGRVVEGVQLVAIKAHEPTSRRLMEPPVLDAARASHVASPAGQPAPQRLGQPVAQPEEPTQPVSTPASAPASPGKQPHGPGGPHAHASTVVRHPGHPGHAQQSQEHGDRGPGALSPGQHAVLHLSDQLGQLLDLHEGRGPGRGPESGSDRGRGHGQRSHEDRGRGHGHEHGRGHAWGHHHGWTRNR
ncbi:hypothetical protein GCM10009844_35570 [Nocardioides koreensis]|uniref:Uncharacterized protein n=1 Tax=Nocardioides koreensis TaxID=433651 RepID=A0ABN3A208_9ACTN